MIAKATRPLYAALRQNFWGPRSWPPQTENPCSHCRSSTRGHDQPKPQPRHMWKTCPHGQPKKNTTLGPSFGDVQAVGVHTCKGSKATSHNGHSALGNPHSLLAIFGEYPVLNPRNVWCSTVLWVQFLLLGGGGSGPKHSSGFGTLLLMCG